MELEESLASARAFAAAYLFFAVGGMTTLTKHVRSFSWCTSVKSGVTR